MKNATYLLAVVLLFLLGSKFVNTYEKSVEIQSETPIERQERKEQEKLKEIEEKSEYTKKAKKIISPTIQDYEEKHFSFITFYVIAIVIFLGVVTTIILQFYDDKKNKREVDYFGAMKLIGIIILSLSIIFLIFRIYIFS